MSKKPAEAPAQQSESDINSGDISDVPANSKAGQNKAKVAPAKKAASNPPITGRKRKRANAAPRQPVKGGFKLPHGMGLALGSASGASSPAANNGEMSQVPDAIAAVDAAAQDTTGTAAGQSLPSVADSTTAGTPDIVSSSSGSESARSGDVTTDTAKDTDTTVLTTPDDEGLEPKTDPPPIDEDASGPSLNAPANFYPSVGEGVQANDQPAPDTEVQQPKKRTRRYSAKVKVPLSGILVIKGAIIQDSVATKTGEKAIEIDAFKVLNPDKKVMVKKGADNLYQLMPGVSPFPWRRVPTAADCETVHKILVDLHGECKPPPKMPAASLEVAGCGEVPCVLDALLRTLISGNTQMERANAAIQKLASTYGLREHGTGKGSINWEKVRAGSHDELALAIRTAGDGPKRSRYIKTILDMAHAENTARLEGEGRKITETTNLLSLDHMRVMTKDEAIKKFVSYPGIGIKTAACVTLFCLQIPCFAVDTHVHRFSIWLGWVPPSADPDTVYRHGDVMVPDHLKYGLHQLFIRHGQTCYKCRKVTRPGTQEWDDAPDCPLEHLLTRNKEPAPPPKPKPKGKRKKLDEVGEDAEAPKPKKRGRKARAKEPEVQEEVPEAEEEALQADTEDSETEEEASVTEEEPPTAEEEASQAQKDESETEGEESDGPPEASDIPDDTSDEDWKPKGRRGRARK